MNKIENQFTSIQQVTDRYLNANSSSAAKGTSDVSFEEILKRKQDVSEAFELKFSKHAAMRLEDRNINLSRKQSERLEAGVQKGIQESLVMVDSLAFIVNVPNKTVVTAMDQGETEKNVFTNIDGAVIA
mgnify:CR=1 FL=1